MFFGSRRDGKWKNLGDFIWLQVMSFKCRRKVLLETETFALGQTRIWSPSGHTAENEHVWKENGPKLLKDWRNSTKWHGYYGVFLLNKRSEILTPRLCAVLLPYSNQWKAHIRYQLSIQKKKNNNIKFSKQIPKQISFVIVFDFLPLFVPGIWYLESNDPILPFQIHFWCSWFHLFK